MLQGKNLKRGGWCAKAGEPGRRLSHCRGDWFCPWLMGNQKGSQVPYRARSLPASVALCEFRLACAWKEPRIPCSERGARYRG